MKSVIGVTPIVAFRSRFIIAILPVVIGLVYDESSLYLASVFLKD